jgi:hypothetical protein
VLSAAYPLSRRETLDALDMLTQMPVLKLERHEPVLELVRTGRSGNADLPEVLIGSSAKWYTTRHLRLNPRSSLDMLSIR